MRSRVILAAVLLAACLALPAGPAVAAPDPAVPHLVITPTETVAGASVSATGSCPENEPVGLRRPDVVPDPDEPTEADYPDATELLLDGKPVEGSPVPLDIGGEFTTRVPVPVPPGATPGELDVETGCGGLAQVVVLEAPTLDVTPSDAVRGQQVIATGTCPGPIGRVQVFLDEEEVAVVLQQADGRLGEVPVDIPADASAGTHTVTTSCQGSDTVEVSIPVDPDDPTDPEDPEDPDPEDPTELVPVPNLQGLTAPQAATVLAAGDLVLADGEVGPGTVTGQAPSAGELVAVGSAVSIELTVSDPSPFPLLPAAGGGSLLLLVLLGAPLTLHRRRLGRERRWLERDVAVTPGSPTPMPGPESPGPAAGLDIRLVVRRRGTPPPQEGPLP
jgi:hypothetical protein